MNCAFKPFDCPQLLKNYKCFRCQNCQKNLSIVDDPRVNLEGVFAKFTNCPANPEAVVAPAGSEAASAAPYYWDPAGAGTQLKKLLAKVGIKSTENCSCNTRAKLMNANGIEWCEQNVPEIVGWLKEESAKRGLPFLALPAKIVVQRAIKLAKRAREKSAEQPESSSAA